MATAFFAMWPSIDGDDMTDSQYRVLYHAFSAAGLVLTVPFAWAELVGRRAPLPSYALLAAIICFLVAWVFEGLSRP